MNATKPLLFLVLLISLRSLAQDPLPSATHAFHLSKLPHEGVLLDKDWRFHNITTKPTGQGTGLGLSLSYDIVNAHGGELKVRTEEGNETEFIIYLPII